VERRQLLTPTSVSTPAPVPAKGTHRLVVEEVKLGILPLLSPDDPLKVPPVFSHFRSDSPQELLLLLISYHRPYATYARGRRG
jgi:hypothetical protein